MRCLSYMNIIEILRLHEMQCFTQREIAASVGCSKTTVSELLSRCRACGLTYDDAQGMTQDRINELVYPDSFGPKQVKEEPDWEYYHAKLQSSSRMNLQYIWTEIYRPAHPDGYSYSRFCAKYNKWKDETGKKVVLPQENIPGRELFIDWIGDTLPCVIDIETGELHEAHFFVTTMGDSSYPFVEAFPDETQLNWLQAHIDALNWYGGVPKIFVPDNTKTAVIHTSLYDPELNHGYRDLAIHYGVAIMPARVRKPKDKPSVESGVGWLETWLLEWLSDRTYYSFEALNHDIRERVEELSQRDFQQREGSRRSVFDALDKPALRPLPLDNYEAFSTKIVNRVANNYHVDCDKFHYSVPYSYYKRKVIMHIYAKKIEIFNENGDRIAIHQRHFSGRRYVTDPAHMPENHRVVTEYRHYDASRYRSIANAIGIHAAQFVDALFENVDFEEQAYKSCQSIIGFSKKYGNERVDLACNKAISLNSVNYTTLRNILKNGQELTPANTLDSDADTPTPEHDNLRTGEWS